MPMTPAAAAICDRGRERPRTDGAAPVMNTKSRRAGLALALACVLATPSCVTAALWDKPCSHHGWRQSEVVGRVLLSAYACAQGCGHCGHGCR